MTSCTSITVVAPTPVVTIGDIKFASESSCGTKCSADVGDTIKFAITLSASVACTARVDISYTKPDGTTRSISATNVSIGTTATEQCFSDSIVYVAGTYSNLVVSVTNIVASVIGYYT